MFQMQSLYPEELVSPMREELTSVGFQELRTTDEVDSILAEQKGTTLVVVNSVCGCAAGNARPGIRIAMKNAIKPDQLTTVFAGVDREATERARSYILGYPPSSPSMALFKDGELVHFIPRLAIEGNMPEYIAADLKQAFDKYCK